MNTQKQYKYTNASVDLYWYICIHIALVYLYCFCVFVVDWCICLFILNWYCTKPAVYTLPLPLMTLTGMADASYNLMQTALLSAASCGSLEAKSTQHQFSWTWGGAVLKFRTVVESLPNIDLRGQIRFVNLLMKTTKMFHHNIPSKGPKRHKCQEEPRWSRLPFPEGKKITRNYSLTQNV